MEDIKKDAPWDMLFADDIVQSKQNHRELDDLEIWSPSRLDELEEGV